MQRWCNGSWTYMVNTARVDFICDHMLLQYPWKFFDAKIPHTLLSWKWYNIFNFRENQGISKLEKGKCFSYINGIKKRWLLLPSLSEALSRIFLLSRILSTFRFSDFCRGGGFLSMGRHPANGYSICPLSFSRHFYGDFCRRLQYLPSIVFSTFLWRFL